MGYVAIIDEIEPAYEVIEGQWKSNGLYTTVHRIAVTRKQPIKGLGTWLLQQAIHHAETNKKRSVRADTNFDNEGMLRVFEKLGFVYCGTVYFRGSARKAFEKVLY